VPGGDPRETVRLENSEEWVFCVFWKRSVVPHGRAITGANVPGPLRFTISFVAPVAASDFLTGLILNRSC
jgi:hypothetical protein